MKQDIRLGLIVVHFVMAVVGVYLIVVAYDCTIGVRMATCAGIGLLLIGNSVRVFLKEMSRISVLGTSIFDCPYCGCGPHYSQFYDKETDTYRCSECLDELVREREEV